MGSRESLEKQLEQWEDRIASLEKTGLGAEDDIELLIMKHDAEEPEVLLVVDAFDDEEEYDTMYQIFAERLDEMYDEEGESEEE